MKTAAFTTVVFFMGMLLGILSGVGFFGVPVFAVSWLALFGGVAVFALGKLIQGGW